MALPSYPAHRPSWEVVLEGRAGPEAYTHPSHFGGRADNAVEQEFRLADFIIFFVLGVLNLLVTRGDFVLDLCFKLSFISFNR